VITLILGGARSGKSTFAERMAARSGAPVTYVATGAATDEDMAKRIAVHRDRRPASWATVEAGADLVDVLPNVGGTVLLDALGTWLARLDGFGVDAEGLCDALTTRPGHTIVVSDEVGMGVHPATAVGREFRDALGQLNQSVAAVADDVFLVVAGRAVALQEGP